MSSAWNLETTHLALQYLSILSISHTHQGGCHSCVGVIRVHLTQQNAPNQTSVTNWVSLFGFKGSNECVTAWNPAKPIIETITVMDTGLWSGTRLHRCQLINSNWPSPGSKAEPLITFVHLFSNHLTWRWISLISLRRMWFCSSKNVLNSLKERDNKHH